MKFIALFIAMLAMVGCKTEIDAKLKVHDDGKLTVFTDRGARFFLPKGTLKTDLVVNGASPEKSYLTLHLRSKNRSLRYDIPLRLPSLEVLLGSNDPVRLDSKTLGQPFSMMVMRKIRPKKDLFIMSFHDPEFNQILGEMTFEYKPSKTLYNENKKEFLASYQQVKRKHRAVVVRIDGDFDGMISLVKSFNWLEKTLSHIINYGGAALISPWAYARYKEVRWLIGPESTEKDVPKWKELVQNYPVIDYFAFVHDGDQKLPREISAAELRLKEGQLRVVYTGACNSKHGTEWLQNYYAVAAAGQRNTSASPLFQFSVMRKWVYGFSFEDSLVKAFNAGVARVRALEWLTFAHMWQKTQGVLYWKDADDLLYDSEILYTFTPEIHAKDLHIGESAIVTRTFYPESYIKKGVAQEIAERNGELFMDKDLKD